MKKLIIEVLTRGMQQTELKHGRKIIKTEQDLLALNTKALMKLYNQVMEKYGYYIDKENPNGNSITDDVFREYVFDKLYDTYENVGILYDPDIQDEMYMADYVLEYTDAEILIIYNHNMFDHNFINWKPGMSDDD